MGDGTDGHGIIQEIEDVATDVVQELEAIPTAVAGLSFVFALLAALLMGIVGQTTAARVLFAVAGVLLVVEVVLFIIRHGRERRAHAARAAR